MFHSYEDDAKVEKLDDILKRLSGYRDYLTEVANLEERTRRTRFSSSSDRAHHFLEMLDQTIPEVAPKTLCSLCSAEEGQESWDRNVKIVDTRKVIHTYAVLCPGCMNRVDSALRGAVALLGQTVEGTQ